ncbi:hypothetical protein Tco_1472571 [Tanacetum coccineum]
MIVTTNPPVILLSNKLLTVNNLTTLVPVKLDVDKLNDTQRKRWGYHFYYPVENKIFVARNADFFERNDTQPSKTNSEQRNEVEHMDVEPYSESTFVDAEEHELGDLNEPPNYKAALSHPEFDKWLDVMNAKMQSMKDKSGVWLILLLMVELLGVNDFSRKRLTWMGKYLGEAAYILGIKITSSEYITVVEDSMEAVSIRKFIDGLENVVPTNKRQLL